MKSYFKILCQRSLMVAAVFFAVPYMRAQDDGQGADAEPAPAAAAVRTDQDDSADATNHSTGDPQNPVDRASGMATNTLKNAIDGRDGVHVQWNHGGEYVGVFNDVEVAEDETADVVVAVRSDYVLKGRSRSDAVAVLGNGDVQGSVEGDCVTVLGGVKVNGPIDGNLVVVGSRAYINAPIRGDVVLVMSKVEFGPNARVSGETVMVGPKPKVSPEATFLGPMRNVNLGASFPALVWVGDYLQQGPIYGRPIAPGVRACWYIVALFFLFRLIVALLFPKPIESGATILRERALRSFIVGLIAYILFLPIQVLLIATGVGAIAVPFLIVALMITCMLGKIALLRSVGGQIGRQLNMPGLDTTLGGFIAGSVLITVIYVVPVLGGIIFLLIKPMALGAMLLAAVDSFRRERPVSTPIPPRLNREATPIAPAQSAAAASVGAATLMAERPVDPPKKAEPQPPPPNPVPPILNRGASRFHDVAPEEMIAMPRVGFWPRIGATALDFALIMFAIMMVFHEPRFFPLIWIVYHIGMWAWRGTTLGGIVFSLRIVRLDGRSPDFGVVLVRCLASCLSFVVAGLGFFWASWNPEKQSWHDMIAGTVIVRTPRSVPLI